MSDLSGEMNYLDVISEASSLKAFWVNGGYMISRANPTVKTIFEKLGIELPADSKMLKDLTSR